MQYSSLLLLRTTAAGLLSRLDTLLVGLNFASTLSSHAHEACGRLPRPLEVARRWLAEEVNLDQVALESALERDDTLDEQRVGVLEVEVHHTHHAHAHELRLPETLKLLLVVCLDGGGDGLRLFGAAHRGRLDVLEDGAV